MDMIIDDEPYLVTDPQLCEKLADKIEEAIDPAIKQKLASPAVRRAMMQNYGAKCFLLADQLKFPICNPDTGQLDCNLLYAAYLRANQYKGIKPGYRELALKAKQMFQELNCSAKIGIRLHESEEVLPLEEFIELIS